MRSGNFMFCFENENTGLLKKIIIFVCKQCNDLFYGCIFL